MGSIPIRVAIPKKQPKPRVASLSTVPWQHLVATRSPVLYGFSPPAQGFAQPLVSDHSKEEKRLPGSPNRAGARFELRGRDQRGCGLLLRVLRAFYKRVASLGEGIFP
jgi:hypothetical protein